jgi:hypothetical protein
METEKANTVVLKTTTNQKKRTYVDAFGEREYEKERYGQEIDDDFFETNVGHGVFPK